MRTISKRWPKTAPRGDYPAYCDFCGTKWRRSELRVDGDGKLYCPQEGEGMCRGDAHRANAQARREEAARSARRATGGRADIDAFPAVTITTPVGGTSLAAAGGDALAGTAENGVLSVELWRGRPYFGAATSLGAATLTGTSWTFATPALVPGPFELYAVGLAGANRVVSVGVKVEVV